MATLVILVGIPGCGKSTWADDLLCTNFHYAKISSDEIRERLGDITDQSKNDLVFKLFHEDIGQRLAHGLDVVADSTALDRFARERLYKIAKENNAKIHVVFFKNVAQAVLRNLRRTERVVPEKIMQRMIEKYERALMDIAQESQEYDRITYVSSIS